MSDAKIEKAMMGNTIMAELMAAMSILSDVQEISSHQGVITEMINHAKKHIVSAMKAKIEEEGLPVGVTMIFSDDKEEG
jgi:fructoselysine-6-P-deglycase FrlB-like protein